MSRDQMIAAAMGRGINAFGKKTDRIKADLQTYLSLLKGTALPPVSLGVRTLAQLFHSHALTDAETQRDWEPMRTRLALIGINSIHSCRSSPESSQIRALYASK